MRREERQIKEKETLLQLIQECPVCRVAFAGSYPYIVPVNFGWKDTPEGLILYFHGAMDGRKYHIVREAQQRGELVGCGFEMDQKTSLVTGEQPCSYSYLYESIIGTGTVCLVEEQEEKQQALNLIMYHMTGKEFFFTEEMTRNTAVFRLAVKEYSGKRHV